VRVSLFRDEWSAIRKFRAVISVLPVNRREREAHQNPVSAWRLCTVSWDKTYGTQTVPITSGLEPRRERGWAGTPRTAVVAPTIITYDTG